MQMNDKQSCPAGILISDQDGQPFAALPSGATAEFVSTDPSIADFVVGPDGMNGKVTSGRVGVCDIGVTVRFPGGQEKTGSLHVEVINSDPAGVNFTAGTPEPEDAGSGSSGGTGSPGGGGEGVPPVIENP